MPVNVSESNFETIIERVLVEKNGYLKHAPADYDRGLCMDPELVIKFIQATQPSTWIRYVKQYPTEAAWRFTQRLAQQIERRGTLYTLRHEFKDSGCHFRLAHFRPNTTLNPAEQKRYRGNIFSIVRQLRYRPAGDPGQPEIDLTLLLNGLPIFTAELKNQFTGQNVQDAIKQYQRDRSSKEPLFKPGRCLAHFAVDDKEVYVTPHLRDEQAEFLPFNRGYNHGAGNPPPPLTSGKFATSYLWEEMWATDSVLNLIQRFVHVYDELDEDGKKTGKKKLIFPRYHQLIAVRELVADARERGPGHRYLIQHSAGSGKTMTISWLAHQLSVLHDERDEPVFDTIVVISDRRLLDRQLQNAVRQFERTRGVVKAITEDAQQLKEALETGKPIIVTTLQKFPVIARQVGDLPGRRFAVIVDEAHSSQSGASTQALHRALEAGSLEEAEAAEAGAVEDMEDVLVREMALRRHLPNVSTFAFTATPKAKTLQLFGSPGPDGKPRPFSLYPMRQAIEEGFILDVLENYVTFKSYWRLLKTIEDDPQYDRKKAQRQLKHLVELGEHAINRKVTIMIEHFAHHVAHRIAGQAKAMIVTRSRLHAVRYKLAVDQYLREHEYPFKSLVAFSGSVKDGDNEYTETGMNTASAGVRIPQSVTADTFEKPAYRLLVVANKFQTGFDQPLLHTMYVDKKLGGVNAVQTLSRLNRIHPHKTETMALDFVNEADHIKKSFEPYYEATLLSEETDPNVLYQLQAELDDYHFYEEEEIDGFVELYFKGRNQDLGALYALLAPVVRRVAYAPQEEQRDFRSRINDFVRLYAFLAQVLPFAETDWEKRFHFYRFLLRRLPIPGSHLPPDIREKVAVDFYRTQRTFGGHIALRRGDSELAPVGRPGCGGADEEEKDPLSVIIEALNSIFGGEGVNGDAPAAIVHLQSKLAGDIALDKSCQVNPPETARLTFDQVAEQLFAEMIDNYYEFYKKVTDDPQAKRRFFDWLFEQYGRGAQEQAEARLPGAD
ncbi:MAG: type I restriction endonuclease subunit R [Anaerolineae bacterium]|nr:type I restriction endonuclease subunit R [Anaerolineae bacterium]